MLTRGGIIPVLHGPVPAGKAARELDLKGLRRGERRRRVVDDGRVLGSGVVVPATAGRERRPIHIGEGTESRRLVRPVSGWHNLLRCSGRTRASNGSDQ